MSVELADGDRAPGRRGPGPLEVARDGLALAASNSGLLRTGSLYIALLALAMVGPAVVAFIGLAHQVDLDALDSGTFSAASFDPATLEELERLVALAVVALLGILVLAVEGSAIGIGLIAARDVDRPLDLRAAVTRSRAVFWRLVRAGLVIGVIDAVIGWLWGMAADAIDPRTGLAAAEPIVSTLVSLPFIYAPVAIVVGDDGALAALRHSIRLLPAAWRVAAVLGLVSLVVGAIGDFALASGVDLVLRVADLVHLDPSAGGLPTVVTILGALCLTMAVSSLVFTVAAIVAAPQTVAWIRLGQSLAGLPGSPPVIEGNPGVDHGSLTDAAPATDAAPTPSVAAPAVAATNANPSVAAPTPGAPPASVTGRPVPVRGIGEPRFHWMTIPMRLTAIAMWSIAAVALLLAPPA